MSSKGEVVVTIDPSGSVKIEVDCVEGPSCQDLTRDLERDLGVVTEDVMTEAFHRKARVLARQGAKVKR